jgi:toxin ParE1/3/4
VTASLEWKVWLTDTAKSDLRNIINWTADHFGDGQAKSYSEMISSALRTLKAGPKTVGVRCRDDLDSGTFILSVARSSKRGRHLIVFKIAPESNGKTLQVLRVLHDAMDLPRHILSGDETEH